MVIAENHLFIIYLFFLYSILLRRPLVKGAGGKTIHQLHIGMSKRMG